jgi:hypothetical protein
LLDHVAAHAEELHDHEARIRRLEVARSRPRRRSA